MPVEVLFVGQTGTGKTTVTQLMARQYGSLVELETSAGACSHTQQMTRTPLSTDNFGDVGLSDGPGLMDTGGQAKDEKNIRIIVDHAKSLRHLHAMLLVLNEMSPYFDKAMQDIVKLLVDSFGSQVLEVMGIVYTHACGLKTHAEAERKTTEIAAIIAERLGLSAPPRLPFWRLECIPQHLERIGAPAEHVAVLERNRDSSIEDILRWSSSRKPISTGAAVYGEYEIAKLKRRAYFAFVLCLAFAITWGFGNSMYEEALKKAAQQIEKASRGMAVVSCTEVIFIGETIVGKSAATNAISAYYNSDIRVETGDGASSHTQQMTRIVLSTPFGDVGLSDGPGLMETGEQAKDERNIRIIVDHAKSLRHLHAMLLVLNGDVALLRQGDAGYREASCGLFWVAGAGSDGDRVHTCLGLEDAR